MRQSTTPLNCCSLLDHAEPTLDAARSRQAFDKQSLFTLRVLKFSTIPSSGFVWWKRVAFENSGFSDKAHLETSLNSKHTDHKRLLVSSSSSSSSPPPTFRIGNFFFLWRSVFLHQGVLGSNLDNHTKQHLELVHLARPDDERFPKGFSSNLVRKEGEWFSPSVSIIVVLAFEFRSKTRPSLFPRVVTDTLSRPYIP